MHATTLVTDPRAAAPDTLLPTTAGELAALLLVERYAILTAGAPRHDVDPQIQAYAEREHGGDRTAALRHMLRQATAWRVLELEGVYQGEPDGASFLVLGMPAAIATWLGRAFGQAEVIVEHGMVECATLQCAPWTGRLTVGEEARRLDYHSVAHLPTGEVAFSLDYDFSVRAPLSLLAD